MSAGPTPRRLSPRAEHLVVTALTRAALTLFVTTVFAGMIAAPLSTTLLAAPVAAALSACLFVSVHRALTECWPAIRGVRLAAATGGGLPLYFAGAQGLGTAGDAVTAILIVVGAVLAVHVLSRDDAFE